MKHRKWIDIVPYIFVSLIIFFILFVMGYIYYERNYSRNNSSIFLFGTKEKCEEAVKPVVYADFDFTKKGEIREFPFTLKYYGNYEMLISYKEESNLEELIKAKKESYYPDNASVDYSGKILVEIICENNVIYSVEGVEQGLSLKIGNKFYDTIVASFFIGEEFNEKPLVLRLSVIEPDEEFKKYNIHTKIKFQGYSLN